MSAAVTPQPKLVAARRRRRRGRSPCSSSDDSTTSPLGCGGAVADTILLQSVLNKANIRWMNQVHPITM